MGSWWSGEGKRAEQKHREELKKVKQEAALERQISQKRTILFKKRPGKSNDFPQGVNVPNRLLITLFGEIGTGKSSLINSLKYTIDGQLENHERIQSGTDNSQGAHTSMNREFFLTDHLSVIDTPGIRYVNAEDDTIRQDVVKRMEGRYTKGTVNWQSKETVHGNEEDKISYCSVMVCSAHNANVARQYRGFIHSLQDWQGCFPLAVITHVDEISPRDVRLALESRGIGDIYEVANITSGTNGRDKVSTEHQLKLLELLQKSFNDGDSIFLRRREIARHF